MIDRDGAWFVGVIFNYFGYFVIRRSRYIEDDKHMFKLPPLFACTLTFGAKTNTHLMATWQFILDIHTGPLSELIPRWVTMVIGFLKPKSNKINTKIPLTNISASDIRFCIKMWEKSALFQPIWLLIQTFCVCRILPGSNVPLCFQAFRLRSTKTTTTVANDNY